MERLRPHDFMQFHVISCTVINIWTFLLYCIIAYDFIWLQYVAVPCPANLCNSSSLKLCMPTNIILASESNSSSPEQVTMHHHGPLDDTLHQRQRRQGATWDWQATATPPGHWCHSSETVGCWMTKYDKSLAPWRHIPLYSCSARAPALVAIVHQKHSHFARTDSSSQCHIAVSTSGDAISATWHLKPAHWGPMSPFNISQNLGKS